ncbi:MAG: lysine--tRNA ligase [Patescibacteria group bacterium]|nr:lysine--tRNA ligase [Patescibacteria group bacterium]
MASLEETRAERLKKLEQLREAGIDPYPVKTKRDYWLTEVVEKFETLSGKNKALSVAGRLRARRGQGSIIFVDLDDGTAKLQLVLKLDELGEKSLSNFENLGDIGDFIQATGTLFVTKQQEKSLLITDWKMLAKSLRALPDKHHGLQDVEERFRRRYLDILMSPSVKERFLLRSKIVTTIRQLLDKAGFLEVETPILQPSAGGASAEPFVAHHHALDIDLHLRVAPELYLKELLIGGVPKIYEISRNFRNEGVDATHNPEFTTVEWYESFSDASKQRKLVEKIIKQTVKASTGGTAVSFNGQQIDFAKPFAKVSYYDLLRRHALILNPESASLKELRLKAEQLGLPLEVGDSSVKLLDAIYKKVCRPKLIQPVFIVDYPLEYLPLAKRLNKKDDLVDAFQVVIGGLELVKAFSELNDPIDQRRRFEGQDKSRAAGDREAQPNDEAFLEALEYGMPPAGGVGLGIDRLTMLLADVKNIKEAILFPTLRPK